LSIKQPDPAVQGDDGKAQMQVDNDVCLLPSQNKLKTLVKALMEYAEVLDWRVWHMQEEPRQDSKEGHHDQRQGQGQDQGSCCVVVQGGLAAQFGPQRQIAPCMHMQCTCWANLGEYEL
jgi:hypothetical protein